MGNLFTSFIIEILGAFIVWSIKGFKGKLSDEMSGPYDSNKKSWRNAVISFAVIFLVVAIVLNNQDNKREETNENIYEIIIDSVKLK